MLEEKGEWYPCDLRSTGWPYGVLVIGLCSAFVILQLALFFRGFMNFVAFLIGLVYLLVLALTVAWSFRRSATPFWKFGAGLMVPGKYSVARGLLFFMIDPNVYVVYLKPKEVERVGDLDFRVNGRFWQVYEVHLRTAKECFEFADRLKMLIQPSSPYGQ